MGSFEYQHQPELPVSLALARELEDSEDEQEIRTKLGTLLDSISSDLHAEFTNRASEIYDGMRSEHCLVRVERLSRILETLELEDTPLVISDEGESHYANAVIPEPEGIKIALAEGQAPGPVRVVVGFGKTLVGFKQGNINVSEIDFTDDGFRDAQERKYLCRHVEGKLGREDIRYVLIRIPSSLVDEHHLTDDEVRQRPPFVFRGIKLPQQNIVNESQES